MEYKRYQDLTKNELKRLIQFRLNNEGYAYVLKPYVKILSIKPKNIKGYFCVRYETKISGLDKKRWLVFSKFYVDEYMYLQECNIYFE